MSSSVLFPVQALREHITALEAALSVCLADPDHKPVHRLRTETRRVEALLLLLAAVPGLPEHRDEASTLLRSLRKLRRAAGEVRDLDVHRKMLDELAEAAPGEDSSASPAQATDSKLATAAADLRKQMGEERDKAASALQNLLKDRQTKTARAAEALLDVLHPADQLPLPAADLLRDAEAVLYRDQLLRQGKVAKLSEDELHSVRKSAKAARYLAETLPEDASLVAAAEQFEALQEAGGHWHDALELARASRQHFGKGHELTASYREQRDQNLDLYRKALEAKASPPKTPKKTAEERSAKEKTAKGPASARRAAAPKAPARRPAAKKAAPQRTRKPATGQ